MSALQVRFALMLQEVKTTVMKGKYSNLRERKRQKKRDKVTGGQRKLRLYNTELHI
jgi:hypothetical protein